MSLSNTAINNAKPKDKNYRLYDEKGLYLEVTKAGGKLWRLKYRFGGRKSALPLVPTPREGSNRPVKLEMRPERNSAMGSILAPINRLREPLRRSTTAIHSRRWPVSGTPGKVVCGARSMQRTSWIVSKEMSFLMSAVEPCQMSQCQSC